MALQRRLRCGLILAGLAVAGALGPASAQVAAPSGFLVLNQERILTGSQAGQRLLADEQAARDALRAEARAIDAAFEEEESRLNDVRPTTDAASFRALADDFDARVVQARRDQDARSSALAQRFDRRRRQFYAAVAPVLVALMARYGAQAIFDESSVLLADQALDITDAVIAEIDAAPAPADAGAEDGPESPDAEPADQGREESGP